MLQNLTWDKTRTPKIHLRIEYKVGFLSLKMTLQVKKVIAKSDFLVKIINFVGILFHVLIIYDGTPSWFFDTKNDT